MVSTRSSGRQTRSDAKATATDTPSKEPSTTNGLREARTSTATGPTAASNSKKRKSVENAATKPPAKRAKAEKTKPANTIVKRGRGRPARSGKGNPRRQVMLEEVVLDPKGRNRRKKEEGEEEGEEGDTKIDSPTKKEDDHNEQDAKEQSRDSEGDGAKEAGREEPVDEKKQDANDHSVEESKEAESGIEVTSEQKTKDKKSTILEKGLIYFFFRPRVQTENPSSLKDVQRSYMVLLPLPEGAILNEEPVKGDGKYRLMAIPKKKLPGAGKHERFLTFVEKPSVSREELKDTFLKSFSYDTKTMGPRTVPAPRPIGEGVYAITKLENDRQSHLAYILTIPDAPNDLQKEFGLQERGSFVISARNPETPAPPQVSIPNQAKYPKEIMDEFNGLRWVAAHPKHLQYENAEILFIGEKSGAIAGADQDALEALEKLEEEDEARVKALEGSDTIFKDLELSKKQVPELKGTWH